jgi:hypothetical protein
MSDIAKVVTKRRLHDADADADVAYWRSRPAIERIAMVQQLRAEHNGWDDATGPRLQRVHCVLRRP